MNPRPRSDRIRREVSAGGVVVRIAEDGTPRVLLIRDSYRNWGFPKGHLEVGERPDEAALREVAEETGLGGLVVVGPLPRIEWTFRFRGRPVRKLCHFYLMRTAQRRTRPQAEEGITACRWVPFEQAVEIIAYDNAREVLVRARELWGRSAPVVALRDDKEAPVRVTLARRANGDPTPTNSHPSAQTGKGKAKGDGQQLPGARLEVSENRPR